MKKIEEKYKEMSEREHVLSRSGMYIGSNKAEQSTEFVYDHENGVMTQKEVEYSPGMLKLVDEIISNSSDEYRRKDNLGLTRIDICITKEGVVTVKDDGGIAVVKHKDAKCWLPEFIFGRLRTSSNYNDDEDRAGIGTNGLGSVLTNIFSKKFFVETCDKKKKWHGEWKDNMSVPCKYDEPKPTKSHYTCTTFNIDFDRFDVKEFTNDFADVICTRALHAAVANPGLKVTFTDWQSTQEFVFRDFKEYIELYRDYVDIKDILEYKDSNKRVFVIPDGNINIGFVNGALCNKGSHIKALHSFINQPISEILSKKNKIELTPRNVDGNYSMFCDVTMSNPTFSSQTKEELTTPIDKFYKDDEKFSVSDSFINKVCKSSILENVMDWYRKKQAVEDQRTIRKLNREVNAGLKRPDKYITCTSKKKAERQLWIFEGDSAKAAFRTCRDPHVQAGYIMRGVPKSSWNASPSELMKNEVYNDLVKIIGLKFGNDFNIDDIKFGKIVISSDMDVDGHHIAGLLIQFANNWPELFEKGIIVRSISPIIIAHKGKQIQNFYSLEEYKKQANKMRTWTFKYTKGLGGLSNVESKEMYQNPRFEQYHKDDFAEGILKKWFNKADSDTRKEMLSA